MYWNGFSGSEDKIQHGQIVNGFEHHKAYGAAAGTGNNQGIHVRHMITHQHTGAFIGNVAQIGVLNAIHGVCDDPNKKAHKEFRNH